MTVPSATSRTNTKADELEFYLRGALIGYGPDAVARILDGFRDHLDAALSEERRLTVERITAVLEPTEPTLDEIAGYGLDGGPGTNFNYLQWRLDRIRAILDEIGGAR